MKTNSNQINKNNKYTYKQLRELLNYTQTQIANLLKITNANYNRIENYKASPRLITFAKYVKAILQPNGLTANNVYISNPDK